MPLPPPPPPPPKSIFNRKIPFTPSATKLGTYGLISTALYMAGTNKNNRTENELAQAELAQRDAELEKTRVQRERTFEERKNPLHPVTSTVYTRGMPMQPRTVEWGLGGALAGMSGAHLLNSLRDEKSGVLDYLVGAGTGATLGAISEVLARKYIEQPYMSATTEVRIPETASRDFVQKAYDLAGRTAENKLREVQEKAHREEEGLSKQGGVLDHLTTILSGSQEVKDKISSAFPGVKSKIEAFMQKMPSLPSSGDKKLGITLGLRAYKPTTEVADTGAGSSFTGGVFGGATGYILPKRNKALWGTVGSLLGSSVSNDTWQSVKELGGMITPRVEYKEGGEEESGIPGEEGDVPLIHIGAKQDTALASTLGGASGLLLNAFLRRKGLRPSTPKLNVLAPTVAPYVLDRTLQRKHTGEVSDETRKAQLLPYATKALQREKDKAAQLDAQQEVNDTLTGSSKYQFSPLAASIAGGVFGGATGYILPKRNKALWGTIGSLVGSAVPYAAMLALGDRKLDDRAAYLEKRLQQKHRVDEARQRLENIQNADFGHSKTGADKVVSATRELSHVPAEAKVIEDYVPDLAAGMFFGLGSAAAIKAALEKKNRAYWALASAGLIGSGAGLAWLKNQHRLPTANAVTGERVSVMHPSVHKVRAIVSKMSGTRINQMSDQQISQVLWDMQSAVKHSRTAEERDKKLADIGAEVLGLSDAETPLLTNIFATQGGVAEKMKSAAETVAGLQREASTPIQATPAPSKEEIDRLRRERREKSGT